MPYYFIPAGIAFIFFMCFVVSVAWEILALLFGDGPFLKKDRDRYRIAYLSLMWLFIIIAVIVEAHE